MARRAEARQGDERGAPARGAARWGEEGDELDKDENIGPSGRETKG